MQNDTAWIRGRQMGKLRHILGTFGQFVSPVSQHDSPIMTMQSVGRKTVAQVRSTEGNYFIRSQGAGSQCFSLDTYYALHTLQSPT